MRFPIVRDNRQEVWAPFQGLSELQHEMNQLFSGFSRGLFPEAEDWTNSRAWAMPLDLLEEKDRLLVRADLPGVKPEEIDVSVQDNTLTIKAQRKQEIQAKEEGFYRRELAYGTTLSQVALPQSVDTQGLKATYRNGVLELSLPKREQVKPKQIKVEVK